MLIADDVSVSSDDISVSSDNISVSSDNISVSSDDISVSSVDDCEENDFVIVKKKILSTDDREKLRRRVAQITILRDWKRVGQLLGLGSVVEEIEYNNHDRMSSCLLEMFNDWLKMDTSFSSYEEGLLKLSTTLDMVGENVLANQLKQECGKWNILSLIYFNFIKHKHIYYAFCYSVYIIINIIHYIIIIIIHE